MKLYIELVVLGFIFLIVFFWAVWYNLTRIWYKWRYEKQNGKQGIIGGGIEQRGNPESEKPISCDERLEQPAKRELLSTADIDTNGKNTGTVGKNSSSTRKGFFFQRRGR